MLILTLMKEVNPNPSNNSTWKDGGDERLQDVDKIPHWVVSAPKCLIACSDGEPKLTSLTRIGEHVFAETFLCENLREICKSVGGGKS